MKKQETLKLSLGITFSALLIILQLGSCQEDTWRMLKNSDQISTLFKQEIIIIFGALME